MKIVRALKRLKILFPLINEFQHSEYTFSLGEKLRGIKFTLCGYRHKCNERIVNVQSGMAHTKVGNYELYVPHNSFKPGELSHLSNEIFTAFEENPHAYETKELQIEKGDYIIDAGACEGFFIKHALQKGAKKVFAFEL